MIALLAFLVFFNILGFGIFVPIIWKELRAADWRDRLAFIVPVAVLCSAVAFVTWQLGTPVL